MLYEFLKDNYKEAEPIFFSDIVIKGITKSAVNQQLKKLCDEGVFRYIALLERRGSTVSQTLYDYADGSVNRIPC